MGEGIGMIKFLRNTHIEGEDGKWEYRADLPKDSTDEPFTWVLHMLESDNPMSFEKLVEVTHAYNNQEDELRMPVEKIALGLVGLLAMDMAKIVKDGDMTHQREVGTDEDPTIAEKAALEAYRELIGQLQEQLRESRDQTAVALSNATQTVRAYAETDRRSVATVGRRREEFIRMDITDGDLGVQFSAPLSAFKDPDVRDAFAKARAVLEGIDAKRRNTGRNPRTS